jgi:RimJ/RimL family protein N-acetyltransferase
MELETLRLQLREYRNEDLEPIHAFTGDAEVAKYSTWGPLTREETDAWLKEAIAGRSHSPRLAHEWAITLKPECPIIGNASIHVRNPTLREVEIGYTLARSEWGRGYATEIARVLKDYCFEVLGAHRIYATASPLNIASHRVLEKAGMVREGILRQNVLQRGRWRDSVIFSALESDLDFSC